MLEGIDEGINEGPMKDRWIKSKKQTKKENNKPKEVTLYKKYATPDRPPPAAVMLQWRSDT